MKYRIVGVNTSIEEGCFLKEAFKLFVGQTFTADELASLGIEVKAGLSEYCDEKGCCRVFIKEVS